MTCVHFITLLALRKSATDSQSQCGECDECKNELVPGLPKQPSIPIQGRSLPARNNDMCGSTCEADFDSYAASYPGNEKFADTCRFVLCTLESVSLQ